MEDELEKIRQHPLYKLFDGYVIDFDLRNYKVLAYQKSSEQAKALLLKSILDALEKYDQKQNNRSVVEELI